MTLTGSIALVLRMACLTSAFTLAALFTVFRSVSFAADPRRRTRDGVKLESGLLLHNVGK